MNRLQDLVSTGGRDRARGSGADSWLGLFTEMMVLPFRMFGMGMQLITRSTQEVQRLGTGGLGGVTSRTPLPPPRPQPPPQSSPAVSAPAYVPPPPGVGSGSSASAVPNLADTTNREEKNMACDKDLSGTDLKIIDYTIVSVDPNIQDDARRILQPTQTVATTEDMTENGFIAWVIAMYFQQPDHRRLGADENWKQYLRVCYCVQCRVAIPEVDCCQQQANALRDINRTLNRLGGLPNAGAEGGQAGQVGQGGGGGGALTPTGRPGRRGAQATAAEGGEGGNV